VNVPRAGSYRLWARTRGMALGAAIAVGLGAEAIGEVAAGSDDWTWVRGPELDLTAGQTTLTLTAPVAGSSVDQILLTTDADYVPEGVALRSRVAPMNLPAVTGLRAEALSPYLVRLDWDAAATPGLDHYNVYCSTDGSEPLGQEHIIGSPVENMRFDWGLPAGAECVYRVTCMDRLGNESPPAEVRLITPAIDRHMEEVATTGELLQAPVSVSFEVPRDDDYVLWLRVASRDEQRSSPPKVALDGRTVTDKWHIPVKYITRGHGGPIKDTWLWVTVPLRKTRPTAVGTLAAGAHTVEIGQTKSGDIVVDGAMVTNDLSYLPEGIVDYRGESRLTE
jgi:hypothetical protein